VRRGSLGREGLAAEVRPGQAFDERYLSVGPEEWLILVANAWAAGGFAARTLGHSLDSGDEGDRERFKRVMNYVLTKNPDATTMTADELWGKALERPEADFAKLGAAENSGDG